MKISHEFPLDFYLKGIAENNTDYDYCLVHRYLDTPEYKEYMLNARKEGREIILDNSLYELGKAFDHEKYIEVVKELQPTYCILPDVFNKYEENLKSQMDFFFKYKDVFEEYNINPMVIPHGVVIQDIVESIKYFKENTPSNTKIAIPFGSEAFNNSSSVEGFLSEDDIVYAPLRQATNRRIFLEKYRELLCDRKIHLLGCKSLYEFTTWMEDAFFIDSIDTSLPVAMTLEGYKFGSGEIINAGNCRVIVDSYKPTFLIDKNFTNKTIFDTVDLDKLLYNIKYFKEIVNSWQLESV